VPVRPQRACAAIATTALAVGLFAAAGPASAHPHPKAHPSHPFVAHGLVVSHTASTLTLVAHDVHTGRSTAHNQRLTVAIPTGRGHAARAAARALAHSAAGDAVTVAGVATGSGAGTTYQAKGVADHPAPFRAYFGTVTAVNGNLLSVAKSGSHHATYTVDVTDAAVTVDGTTGTPAVGQDVIVLGSNTGSLVAATSVWAFSSDLSAVTGEVTSVTGSTVTLDGDDDQGATTVDLTSVPLILNGTSSATADQLTEGTALLVLGTQDADTFTPLLAVGFSHGCTSRNDGDGGRDGNQGGDDQGDGSQGGDDQGSDNPGAGGTDD
jgi:hypothetical protein